MRILIVGAGGLGGYFGAYLLQAGRAVTFLVRPRRAQQMRLHGLALHAPAGDLLLPAPPTVLAGEISQPFDLILLSCKAYDLESAIADFAPAVGPETAILPVLNGIAHLDTLDAHFGRARVLGGLTTVSAAKEPGGRIVHLNQLDLLQFGDRDEPDGPRIGRIAEVLSVAGFDAELRLNILYDMWQKWLSIAVGAALMCLLRASVGDIAAAGAASYASLILDETASIATAEGFAPTPEFCAMTLAKFTEAGLPLTVSILRDIEAGGRIESHQIVGDMIAHARRHALATPLLDLAHAHLRCYEERRKRELAASTAA
jgi:2-dehydropantoate 2-reductase